MKSRRGAGTVLVLSAHEDPTADAVIDELNRRAATVVRMDTGDFPARCQLDATFSTAGLRGRLRTEDAEVNLAAVHSIYYRRPSRFTFPDTLSDADTVLAATEARFGFGGVLGALDTSWVNHPARVATAEYKPIQLHTATQCGLDIPRTLVTNDKAAAIEFADAVGGAVVCKMLSSLVLEAFAVTAHLVQEWVPKKYDVRLTMVGQQVFGVAIHSSSDRGHTDWRSDYGALSYHAVNPPSGIQAAAARFLQHLGLAFGAFDFVVTPEDEWVMLECNPAGQWLWLQDEADVQIAAGIADLLVSGGQR